MSYKLYTYLKMFKIKSFLSIIKRLEIKNFKNWSNSKTYLKKLKKNNYFKNYL